MRMVRPMLEAPQITIAEEQEEYLPVTAAVVHNAGYPAPLVRVAGHEPRRLNTVVLAFRPNEEERARLAAGEDIYVSLLTFMQPMQGIIVSAGHREVCGMYAVPEEVRL